MTTWTALDGDDGIAEVLRRAWPLLLSLVCLTVGLGTLQILLGVRATRAGFPEVAIGVIMSAYYVGYVVASRVVPGFIGRVGHFRTFAALAALFAASTLAHGIVVDAVAWTAIRVIGGFCFAGVFVVTESWLNGYSTNANRGSVLGAYSVLVFGGLAAGQMLLNTSPVDGIRLFSVVAILGCLAVVPVSLTRQPSAVATDAGRVPVARLWRGAPLAVVAAAGSGLSTGALLTLGAVYGIAAGLTVAQISAALAGALLLGVVAQVPVGRISDRVDRRIVIAATAAIAAIAAAAAAFVDVPEVAWALVVLVAVHGAGSFPQYSLALAHLHDRIGDAERVGASGTIVMVQGIGAAAGPLVASVALAVAPPAAFLWYLAGIYVLLSAYAVYRISSWAPVDVQSHYEPVPTGATPVVATMDPEALAAATRDERDERDDRGRDDRDRDDQGVVAVTGGDLHWRRVGSAGTPVVVVHDLASSVGPWASVRVALARAGHVAIAYDLRGHGASSRPSEYAVAEHVADLRAVLFEVAGGPSHLVGQGAGAAIALVLAEGEPGLVRSLTLVSAADVLTTRRPLRNTLVHLRLAVDRAGWRAVSWPIHARTLATVAYDPGDAPEEYALVERDARRADPRAVVRTRQALVGVARRARFEVRCPTLVVTGAGDVGASAADLERLRGRLPPHELLVAEGAGRFVGLDAPEALASAVVDHVARADRDQLVRAPGR